MKEIWVPELISALFLLLFLLRPLIKGLWPLDGLNWFPFLALTIALGLFPAYGFRPECIPLLLYFAVLVLTKIPSLIAGAGSRHNDDFHDRRIIFIFPAALFLALTTAIALFFAPPNPAEAGAADSGLAEARIVPIRDERQNRSYTLYIFGSTKDAAGTTAAESVTEAQSAPDVPLRPLLLVIPPEAGGVGAVDALCASLEDRGFTVISYSRQGFDSFAPDKLYRMWQSFHGGTVSKKANDFGRALETGRKEDLQFLLPYIKRNSADLVPGADPDALIIAGCGAGGAAAVYLTATPAFIAQNKQLRGIVTVESSFWSVYRPEERSPLPVPASANWLKKNWAVVQNWFAGRRPLKMAGLGTVQRPSIPALYIVSDRAMESGAARTRYAAVFDLLQKTDPTPAALIALKGAGPLDYTDYPTEYPLYSALFTGRDENAKLRGRDFTEDTAAAVTGFAAAVLKTPEPAAETERRGSPPGALHNTAIHTEFYLRTRLWQDPPLRSYFQ